MEKDEKLTFFKKIPWLPVSALIFYLSVLVLWLGGIIPSPADLLSFLERLYNQYGLIGLFLASFLEGLVYIGLYFPGSFIVLLAVLLSTGSLVALLSISLVVAFSLTITSSINYLLGRNVKKSVIRNSYEKKAFTLKALLLSSIHPNSLAFYFFNEGVKKRQPHQIILVPLIMIPYGFILANLFYFLKEPIKNSIDTPFVMIAILFIWVTVSFLIKLMDKNKK